jgi:hypothetical protein
MRISYLILAHANLPQLDKMIAALHGQATKFFLHIDKKISAQEWEDLAFSRNSSVTLIRNRVSVNWGGFSMIKATLALVKAALAEGNEGYFVLLSGQDFPVKTNSDIKKFLEENYPAEFMTYWSMPYAQWQTGGLNRITQHWLVDKLGYKASRILFHLQRLFGWQRRPPADLKLFGGLQWWCLTGDCLNYVIAFLDQHPEVLRFYQSTLAPDEMFFQTIILNSPFRERVANDNLRFLKFEGTNFHPLEITRADLSVALASPALWARKFNELEDKNILDDLEKALSEGAPE